MIVKSACTYASRISNENVKLWEIRQKNQINRAESGQKIWQIPNKPLVQD